MTVQVPTALTLRPITEADSGESARIAYEAFAGIHDRHAFPRDFPTLETAAQLVETFIAHPAIHGVVAEAGGRILGSNFLDERGPIGGIGPITVDPHAQASGVGRRLMEAVLERGERLRGVRLLQDSFNVGSLSLYASLGFEVREPVALIGGRPRTDGPLRADVRPLRADDLSQVEELALRVHGHERTREVRDALATLDPTVLVRDGRITAYATTLTLFAAAHAVAETEEDMRELIAGTLAATEAPASFLLPTRQHELFRSLLAAGLRVVKPMTYMTVGEYQRPSGAWIPTVLH